MELSYYPHIPLLGINSKESNSAYNGDTCTPNVYCSGIYKEPKLWNQSRCPSMEEWIKK
jgi:hypothetical protein